MRRADPPSRGVLTHVVCLTECDLETSTTRTPRSSEVVEPWGKERENRVSYCSYVSS
jgi:hypothetical protein